MKKLLLLPVFVFLCAPVITLAQTNNNSDGAAIKNTLGFGPRVGFYKANDAEEGNFYGGLQSRLRFGPIIGIEGSVEYRAGQEYSLGGQAVQTKFVPVTVSGLLFLPMSENFAPYGIAGLGAYYTIYDYKGPVVDGHEDEFNFGYHLGFGVELPINSNAAVNIDYRYLFMNPEENETSTENANYSGNVFTAGLMFYL